MDEIERLGDEYDLAEQLGNEYDKKQKKPSYWDRIMEAGERLGQERNKGFHAQNSFNLGGAQQIGEMGTNVLNLLPGVDLKKPNLKRELQDEHWNPIFNTGQVAGGLAGGGAAYGAARALPLLSGGGVLPAAGAGALAGGVTGGDTPEQRALGALLGSTAGLGAGASRITNRAVGNQIVRDANELQHAFTQGFDNVFDEAARHGLRNITRAPITPARIRDYRAITTEKELKKVRDFMQNPSIRNAHEAQSDIGAAIRRMENMPRNNAVTDAINAAEEMREGLLRSIENQFEHHGAGHIAEEYQGLRAAYAEHMAPYLNNKNIVKARKSPRNKEFMEPHRLPHELSLKGNDSFNRLMLAQYPELRLNRMLAGPIGKGALGLAGLGSIGGLAGYALKER